MGEIERSRDIALREGHHLLAHLFGAGLRHDCLALKGADGLLRRADETFKSFSGLLHALLGKGAHICRDVERIVRVIRHENLLPPHCACSIQGRVQPVGSRSITVAGLSGWRNPHLRRTADRPRERYGTTAECARLTGVAGVAAMLFAIARRNYTLAEALLLWAAEEGANDPGNP